MVEERKGPFGFGLFVKGVNKERLENILSIEKPALGEG